MFRQFRIALSALVLIVLTITSAAQPEPTIVGYIAYVGLDHNIYVLDDTQTPTQLTYNADVTRRYQFPTWSTDGRLAFFCCDPAFAPELSVQTFVASPDLTAAKLLYTADNEGYTYSYWSPANCDTGPSCRDLALLISQPGQPFKVELIRQNGSETTSRTIGAGAPFYFSWNRDGKRMLWHRNNQSVSIYDASVGASINTLALSSGGLQAPAWSPVDDQAAVTVLEPSGTSLSLITIGGDTSRILVQGIPRAIRGLANVVALNWSPDGKYIAYRVINPFGASPVFVVDVVTGATIVSTSEANVLAFFWSPDSSKLAYVTPSAAEGGAAIDQTMIASQPDVLPLFDWSILDINSETTRLLTGFTPTLPMSYLLTYFDQFSQSHRLWSPDSRYLVYGDAVTGGTSSVTIIDTSSVAPVPLSIATGEIGIWSFN